MHYKEKYEEALERAKAGKPMDEVFPELKESEDERIRKEIIGYLETKVATVEETELLYFKRWIAYLEKQKEQKPAEWSEEDMNMIGSILSTIELNIYTDPHCSEIHKKELEWFNNLYYRGALQPKQEWSEEDEENFKWFDKFFRAESVVANGRDIPQDKYLWFKSLRPQPHWKPSEEQMEWLESAVRLPQKNHTSTELSFRSTNN